MVTQIAAKEGKRAHDEQAGHGDADSRKGHKAVEEDAAKTFLD